MLFSRGNLTVRKVASKDPKDRIRSCVHFAYDGSSVATNGRCLMAVGPVDTERVRFPEVAGDENVEGMDVSVELDVVDTAVRNMRAVGSAGGGRGYCKITKCSAEGVEFTTVGKRKIQRVEGRPVRGGFLKWQDAMKEARKKARVGSVCLHRGTLIDILTAMEEAAEGSDGGAVFIEFGGRDDEVILRSVNRLTGQHIVGLVGALKTGGKWIRADRWVRKIFGISVRRLFRPSRYEK